MALFVLTRKFAASKSRFRHHKHCVRMTSRSRILCTLLHFWSEYLLNWSAGAVIVELSRTLWICIHFRLDRFYHNLPNFEFIQS